MAYQAWKETVRQQATVVVGLEGEITRLVVAVEALATVGADVPAEVKQRLESLRDEHQTALAVALALPAVPDPDAPTGSRDGDGETEDAKDEADV